MKQTIALMAGFLLIATGVAQETPKPTTSYVPIRASKIILVGDSTMQVHSGWGGSFCAHHVTSFAACVNLARGGRSTKSYRAEGSWDLALAEMKTSGFVDTWVLIQLGHNDQPGKAERSTDLATEVPANLRRYVEEARAAGAQPVLITPLTRRMFKGGQLQNDLAPWAAATIKIATDMKVPLVDLNAKSAEAVQAMGPVAANEFAQVAPSPEIAAAAKTGTTAAMSTAASPTTSSVTPQGQPTVPAFGQINKSFDYTHLGEKGADYFAKMVTDELASQVPEMRPLLVP
jgi:lysophospholipase L1-like esterase